MIQPPNPSDSPRDAGDDVDPDDDEATRSPAEISAASDAHVQRSAEIAREICALMGIEVFQILGSLEGDDVIVRLEGVTTDISALDERAFESVQFLINKATQRLGSRRSRVNIRVEGARSRRRDDSDAVAQWLCQRVQQVGRVATVGPLEGADVRTWTSALQRIGYGNFQVGGGGDLRKIALRPEGVDADGVVHRNRKRRRRRRT